MAEYSGWKGDAITGELIKGAEKFISTLINDNYKPVIFSIRKSEITTNWIKKYDFPKLEITNTKLHSLAYIDDRGIQFNGSFSKLTNDLKK